MISSILQRIITDFKKGKIRREFTICRGTSEFFLTEDIYLLLLIVKVNN